MELHREGSAPAACAAGLFIYVSTQQVLQGSAWLHIMSKCARTIQQCSCASCYLLIASFRAAKHTARMSSGAEMSALAGRIQQLEARLGGRAGKVGGRAGHGLACLPGSAWI